MRVRALPKNLSHHGLSIQRFIWISTPLLIGSIPAPQMRKICAKFKDNFVRQSTLLDFVRQSTLNLCQIHISLFNSLTTDKR